MMDKMLSELLCSPFIKTAYQLAREDNQDIFLVGGALRDLYLYTLLGEDLDFILERNTESISLLFSQLHHGTFFCLDRKRKLYRVIITQQESCHTIDFALLAHKDIVADLNSRDLTINSLALSLSTVFEKNELDFIDPTGGLKDLKNKVIRASTPDSYSQDPVRMLRAVRFSQKCGFPIEQETRALIERQRSSLLKSPWERIRSEFFKILALPQITHSLRKLDQLGILSLLIPEVEQMKDATPQDTAHVSELWEHTLKTVTLTESILRKINDYFPRYGDHLITYFSQPLESDVTRSGLLIFMALLNDTYRSLTHIEADKGLDYDHFARIRTEINLNIAKRFMLGRKAQQIILTATDAHLRLYTFLQLKKITHRAKYRLLRDLDGAEVESIVLSMAESIAKDISTEKGTLPLSNLLSGLITYSFEEYPPVEEKSLLSGNEIMEALQLKQGEDVGRFLEHIENAERKGTVSTKEEALSLIRSSHHKSGSRSREKEETD